MELKEGMHVRKREEGLTKISSFWERVRGEENYDKFLCEDNTGIQTYWHDKNKYNYMPKPSFNLINLIEAGDVLTIFDTEYQENYKSEVSEDNEGNLIVINYEGTHHIDLLDYLFNCAIKIEKILTKDQYVSNAYKVNN